MNIQAPIQPLTGPANFEAEQSVLGACLMSREALSAVGVSLEPRHFSEELHARIYSVMLERLQQGAPATLVSLGPFLRDIELPGGVTIAAYLVNLARNAPGVGIAPDYARQIVDLWRRREIIRVAGDAIGAAQSPAVGGETAQIAADVIDACNEIVAARSEKTRRSIGECSADLIEHTRRIRAKEITSRVVTTGFKDVDRATGGYEDGFLWIVGARPGVGKTIWQVTSSLKVARAGARAARDGGEGFGAMAYSLEVPEKQITARYISDLSYSPNREIEYGRIARGDFDDEEAWRIEDADKRLARLPLTIDSASRITMAEIGAGVRAEKAKMARNGFRLAVVFIDYLKFIKASDRYKGQRHYEVGEISAGLKQLAKDEGLCVVLLAQLNRALENREDKRPNLSDLRESGDLEADADVVAFIHREAHHVMKSPDYRSGKAEAISHFEMIKNDAELILGKNRAGRETTAHLWCQPSCSAMSDSARGMI
jgi:replicative DNA helicase